MGKAGVMITVAVLIGAGVAHADTFTGKVVGVAEGDTITVLRDRKPIKIRLHGVDTPEKRQAFGQKAKQLTSKLVFGKEVKVEVVTKDRYGRTVGRVSYLGKLHRNPLDRSKPHQVVTVYRSLQEALVQAGLAWWYRKYAPKATTLAKLEAEAQKAKRGLWVKQNPVAPWAWRKGVRVGSRIKGGRGYSPPVQGVLKGTMVGEAFGTAAVDVKHPITGNVRSKVYHWFTCKHANCKNCKVHFKTIEQAQAAGYRPHRACMKTAPSKGQAAVQSNLEAVRVPGGGKGYKE